MQNPQASSNTSAAQSAHPQEERNVNQTEQTPQNSDSAVVLALTVSYKGTLFSGFSKQPWQRTVQGDLEDALALLYHREVELTCSGRTDAGVHAIGQVVSCPLGADEAEALSEAQLIRSLNALTHEDIIVRHVEKKPSDFSARFSAVMREYRYFISTDSFQPLFMKDFSWHISRPLNVENMQKAGQYLIGEHDFRSFCTAASAKGKRTFRFIEQLSVTTENRYQERLVVITIRGNAFLHSMVRTIVGTLVAVGLGNREPEWVKEVLEAKNRQSAGETAPAKGLVFWEVSYDGQRVYTSEAPSTPSSDSAATTKVAQNVVPKQTNQDEHTSKTPKTPQSTKSTTQGEKSANTTSQNTQTATTAKPQTKLSRKAKKAAAKQKEKEALLHNDAPSTPSAPVKENCAEQEGCTIQVESTTQEIPNTTHPLPQADSLQAPSMPPSMPLAQPLTKKEIKQQAKEKAAYQKQAQKNAVIAQKQAKKDAIAAQKQAQKNAVVARKQAKKDEAAAQKQAKKDAKDYAAYQKQAWKQAKKDAKINKVQQKKVKKEAIAAQKQAWKQAKKNSGSNVMNTAQPVPTNSQRPEEVFQASSHAISYESFGDIDKDFSDIDDTL